MKTFIVVLTMVVAASVAGCAALQSRGGGQLAAVDVAYEPAHGLKLDVYAPRDAQDAPVIVFFYGERWEHGNKSKYGFVGQALAAQGFVTMIPDYRLYPPATYKQFLSDCAQAVVWAHKHAGDYGGSARKLFVMGFSGGAYNAAMLALDPAFLKAAGGSRDHLAGMIGISGPYDFLPITAPDLRAIFGPPGQFMKTQPLFWVDGNNPPMLLIASDADRVVNANDTRELFNRIKQANGTVATVFYKDLSNLDTINVLAIGHQDRADEMKNIVAFVHHTVAARKASPESEAGSISTQPVGALSAPPPSAPIALPPPAPAPAPAQSVAAPASAAIPAAPASVR